MIRNIIFDIGNVLTDFRWKGFLEDQGFDEAMVERIAFDNVNGMVTKRGYAIPWIQELKAWGYRVYYLSNFSEKAYEDCRDALDFLPYMDGGILSFREKVVKPDAGIYELLLSRYALKAEESVFLDDTAKNVDAAKALGIHGICFQTKEQAEAELKLLGVGA